MCLAGLTTLGVEGLEPPRHNRSFNRIFPQSGAPDGALDAFPAEIWHNLDARGRAAIVAAGIAMAHVSGGTHEQ